MNSAELILSTLPTNIQHSPQKVMEYAHTKTHNCLGLDDVHRTTIEFADGSKLIPSGKLNGRMPDVVWEATPKTLLIERPRIKSEAQKRLKRR